MADLNKMHIDNLFKVCDNLYLSDQEAALNHQLCKTLQFKLVVNCTNHTPYIKPRNPNTTYIKVAVEDNCRQKEVTKLISYLPYIVEVMHGVLSQNNVVLVHCRLGRQRSATVVAAYLMWERCITMTDAIKHIQRLNPTAFQPEANFKRSLEMFEVHLRGKVIHGGASLSHHDDNHEQDQREPGVKMLLVRFEPAPLTPAPRFG